MDIEKLILDNYPKVEGKFFLYTQYTINSNEKINISLDNEEILDNEDIKEVKSNCITLYKDISEYESIVVIYNKI